MQLNEMLQPYSRILERCEPYVVATRKLQARLDLEPLGLPIIPEHRFDPLRVSSAPFLDRVQTLDALTYGPVGMAMPRWALYDCAEMAGALVGLGTRAAHLPARLRKTFAIPERLRGPRCPIDVHCGTRCLASAAGSVTASARSTRSHRARHRRA